MDGLLLVCLTGICASPDPLLLYERLASQAERVESVTSSSEQPAGDRPMLPSQSQPMLASRAAPIGATIQAPAPIDSEAERDMSDAGISANATPRSTARSTIAGIVKANSDAVRLCYERGLTDDPTFRGTIEVGWKIDRTGRVTSTNVFTSKITSKITSTKGSQAVEGCLRAAIAGWSFPASAEPVVVSYPFTFDATLLHHRPR